MLESRKAIGVVIDERRVRLSFVQHEVAVRTRNAVHPALVRFRRTVQAHRVLHDDISNRHHFAAGHVEIGHGVALHSLRPLPPPTAQRRSEIAESLNGVEIGRQGHDHVVRRHQRGSIECAEIRADVYENEVGLDPVRRHAKRTPKGRHHAERTRLPVETVRPLAGELVLGP